MNPLEAQTDSAELPYASIGDYPASYSQFTVMARMIDGLGYRYYWATESLRPEDLAYKPSADGRTTTETLEHIYGLVITVGNTIAAQPNIRPSTMPEMTFEEQRAATLRQLKQASNLLLKMNKQSLADLPIVFQRGDQKAEYPFWNLINGPLADAIYHVGQLVAFRRASGNPMNPKVNMFAGKNR